MPDEPMLRRCMLCHAHFALTHAMPRMVVSAVTLTLGGRSVTLETPNGAWGVAVCPSCSVEHCEQLTQLERDGFPPEEGAR